jgi:hypothetical protein
MTAETSPKAAAQRLGRSVKRLANTAMDVLKSKLPSRAPAKKAKKKQAKKPAKKSRR